MELLLQLRIWNWGFWLWFFLLSVSPALAEEQTNVSITAENVFEKFFAVTSDTSISPLTPLKKRVAEIKVSLFKGDLEGSKTFDTDKRTFQTSSEALFAQNTEIATEVLQVTAVKANPTGKGVEIILQTDQGQQLQITNRSADNSFIADIPNAQLRLSSGDAFTFRSQKPIEGITEITVTNFDANTIRVTVVGEAGVPVVELFDSPDEGLIFSVASTIASTPLQQPQPSQPESETQPEQPSTQGDEPIELVVMGEQDGYRVPNASTATRTDTPLRDIPQSIQVIPRQVLEDQGATSAFGLRDALRNVSGVQPAFTGGNTVTGRSIIRGFVQSSTFQDGFRSGDELLRDSANIERIEVLKGPASVLYGDVQPGGIINITTKQPLIEPFYSVGLEVGSFGLIRPTIDLSGPLNPDRTLLYRLNLAYERGGYFRNFDQEIERFFVAPVLTWRISEQTNLTFNFEYLNGKSPFDQGIVAFGTGVADIPQDILLNEPDGRSSLESIRASYRFEHRLSKTWLLRNAFQFSSVSRPERNTNLGSLDEETGELERSWLFAEPNQTRYDLQTNLLGEFSTGSIKHKLLFGVDLSRARGRFDTRLEDAPSINIFNPIYRTASFPAPNSFSIRFESDSTIDNLGIYLQDQIALAENLKLLAGGRFDLVDQKSTFNGDETQFQADAFTPRFGIVYQPIQPLSLFASYSQSFIPNSATTVDGSLLPPERGTQYEVGIKGEFLDGKLSATLSAFDITKSNVSATDLDNPDFSIAIGEQRSQGIELDIIGEILPGWNVIASYANIDAKITRDNSPRQGNQLDGVPYNAASLWTTYEIQGGDLKGLGVGLGLFYVGERQGDLNNSFRVPDFLRTDASIFYRRDNWRAGINIKNLFDVDYIDVSQTRSRVNVGAPLTVVGSFSIEF